MNKDVGRLINVHIPVIGGPSTGKSNFIVTATHQLIQNWAVPQGYQVDFPDEKHLEEYENNVKSLSAGKELLKTVDKVPQAYNIAIKGPGDRVGRILYVYDAAGEAYAVEDTTLLQTYYKYVHGLIFLIDPFSIDKYYRTHEQEIDDLRSTLRPGTQLAMHTYERMITVLESSFGIKRDKKFRLPVAVVISKTDALGLENEIGQPAAQELMKNDPTIKREEDAIHQLVERFLTDNGLGNLIRDLNAQFANVFFFSCSALGRIPDPKNEKPFKPVRVLEPLQWVLSEAGVIKERSSFMQRLLKIRKFAFVPLIIAFIVLVGAIGRSILVETPEDVARTPAVIVLVTEVTATMSSAETNLSPTMTLRPKLTTRPSATLNATATSSPIDNSITDTFTQLNENIWEVRTGNDISLESTNGEFIHASRGPYIDDEWASPTYISSRAKVRLDGSGTIVKWKQRINPEAKWSLVYAVIRDVQDNGQILGWDCSVTGYVNRFTGCTTIFRSLSGQHYANAEYGVGECNSFSLDLTVFHIFEIRNPAPQQIEYWLDGVLKCTVSFPDEAWNNFDRGIVRWIPFGSPASDNNIISADLDYIAYSSVNADSP